jgi:hypothetical protein
VCNSKTRCLKNRPPASFSSPFHESVSAKKLWTKTSSGSHNIKWIFTPLLLCPCLCVFIFTTRHAHQRSIPTYIKLCSNLFIPFVGRNIYNQRKPYTSQTFHWQDVFNPPFRALKKNIFVLKTLSVILGASFSFAFRINIGRSISVKWQLKSSIVYSSNLP